MAGLFNAIFGKPVKESYLDPLTDEYRIVTTDGTHHQIPAEEIANAMINSRIPPITPPWATTTKGPFTNNDPLASEDHRIRLIRMRLRIHEGDETPYQFLTTHLSGEKVFVFVVQDGQPVTLEDASSMFPSDQLITQLRLLEK